MTSPKFALRFLMFKSDSCGLCAGMDKAQTIENFIKANAPAATIQRLSCADKDGETPENTDYHRNYILSDAYDVQAFPTVILEAKLPDGSGLELSRIEGGATKKAFTDTFEQAIEAFGSQYEEPEEGKSQNEASRELNW